MDYIEIAEQVNLFPESEEERKLFNEFAKAVVNKYRNKLADWYVKNDVDEYQQWYAEKLIREFE
jgi:hypothetical protein